MEKPSWTIDKNKPYFVNDPEGDGMSYFACKESRDNFAEDCIREYLDDGWMEEGVNVISGEVTHRATMVDRQSRPEDLDEEGCDELGNFWPEDFDFICNYIMKPLTESGGDCHE